MAASDENWFCIDSRILLEPAVQLLTPTQFRFWVNLICYAARQPVRGIIQGKNLNSIAVMCCRRAYKLAIQHISVLEESELIIVEGDSSKFTITIAYLVDYRYTKSGLFRPQPSVWAILRQKVFLRDGFRCVYCGSTDGPFECDHIHPVSRGGSSELKNLATACQNCNRSKSNKTTGEWLGNNSDRIA